MLRYLHNISIPWFIETACLTMRYGNMQDDVKVCGHTSVGVNDESLSYRYIPGACMGHSLWTA